MFHSSEAIVTLTRCSVVNVGLAAGLSKLSLNWTPIGSRC